MSYMIASRARAFVKFSICILIGAIFSSVVAFAWTGPTQTAPNGNVSAPVNVGTTDQTKNAGLGINSLAVFGDAILAGVNSYLNFGAAVGSSGYGIRDNAGTMEFKNSGGAWSSITSSIQSFFSAGNTISQIKFADGTTQTTAASGSAKVFVGITSSAYMGSQVAGYAGGNAKCAAAFGTGARMCATSDFPDAIPNSSTEAWYNGFDTVPFARQDCEAWTSNSHSSYGHTWSAIGTPDDQWCDGSFPIMCCK